MTASTFKFDFTLDDTDVDPDFAIPEQLARVQLSSTTTTTSEAHPKPEWVHQQRCVEFTTDELLERLPDMISYSPLVVPVLGRVLGRSTAPVTLVRRDLFDARFQLIARSDVADDDGGADAEGKDGGRGGGGEREREKERETGLAFVEAPSDLVPGVYEGGLKTWEGSVDLAGYLAGHESDGVKGKRVLEIGCGTAVPSMYLLHQLFENEPPEAEEKQETQIHLQDYNASVLELVSFPNLLLTWYMSSAAAPFRGTAPSLAASSSSSTTTAAAPPPDPNVPGELPLTPLLKASFLKSLEAYRVKLRFFAGPWEAFDMEKALEGKGMYDVVLTSETVYRVQSLPGLLGIMRGAAGVREGEREGQGDGKEGDEREATEHMCLVAAKVLYFGVGGGVAEFVEAVKAKKGEVEIVWEGGVGIGRRIMRVRW